MGRKKFNKKDASVYHLVRRSQRDVGGYIDDKGEQMEVPSDFVLIPSEDTLKRAKEKKKNDVLGNQDGGSHNHNEERNMENADDALMKAKSKLTQANLTDDYNYEQHMAPMSGTGVFVPNESNTDYYTNEIRSKKLDLIDPMIKEVDRQLDSIALTSDCMDDDIAHALFADYENGDFEEPDDDLCFTANQEEPIHDMTLGNEGGEGNYGGDGGLLSEGFDFDAHIDKLLARIKAQENGGGRIALDSHTAWTEQQQMFMGKKPLKNKKNRDLDDLDSIDEDDEDENSLDREFSGHPDYFTAEENPGIVPKLNATEESALCDKFEKTLLEYDSDEVGDLDEQCYDIKGDKPFEGDRQIEAAIDQFLQNKQDEKIMMGTTEKRVGGSSRVFVNNKLVPYNNLDNIEGVDEEEKVEDVLAEAQDFLANPEVDLPPEEVLIDGKSYFTMKEKNPWDCESILSTYSNMDNNPAVVGRSGRRRNKKKKKSKGGFDVESIAEEKPVQILLSDKTGLPLGVLPGPKGFMDGEAEDTFVSVNRGEARKKNETKEEKRARKLIVKQERQVARIQKKMMREAIQEEFGERAYNDVSNDIGGKSVFKYS